MRNFISFIKDFRFYKKVELSTAIKSFNPKEYFLFVTFIIIALVSMIIMLNKINNIFTVEVPDEGGTIIEGIVGVPTLINPVLALSDADKDLTAIVFSGLMRKTSEGTLIPDLAESYTSSTEGLVYTFILKKDAKFHNGDKVTADDVVFTINKIKDPIIKSPRKNSWDGVTVTKKDENTIEFSLTRPYISFMDNTTIGILPSKVWNKVNESEFGVSSLNVKAVGSGPYEIKSVNKNKEGIPEKYKLNRFSQFTLGTPHIRNLIIQSFPNEKDLIKALNSGSIDQANGISPENAEGIEDNNNVINTATLPRMFGVFFNKNKNKIFAEPAIIKAFDLGIDRQNIIDQVLLGYGTVIHSPVPENISKEKTSELYKNAKLDEAAMILDKAGWIIREDGIRAKGGTTLVTQTSKIKGKTVTKSVKSNAPLSRLSFSITTGDTKELRQATTIIKEQLAVLGVEVDIKKIYEAGQLNQIIRARDYEALFFGQIISHESDLYSFWHSSQINDPGLNIAMYNNKKIDLLLDSTQKTLDPNNRDIKYQDLIEEFNKDIPALLIYSPKFLYATSKSLKHIEIDNIRNQSDRFASIYNWYANTNNVWKIFNK